MHSISPRWGYVMLDPTCSASAHSTGSEESRCHLHSEPSDTHTHTHLTTQNTHVDTEDMDRCRYLAAYWMHGGGVQGVVLCLTNANYRGKKTSKCQQAAVLFAGDTWSHTYAHIHTIVDQSRRCFHAMLLHTEGPINHALTTRKHWVIRPGSLKTRSVV